jgi:pyrroloquinoline quinone biosynthesis protein D
MMAQNNPPSEQPGQNSRPRLRQGVRLKSGSSSGTDEKLLFPEGFADLDEPSAAVLALCNGQRSVGEITAELARQFDAPQEQIAIDVTEYLRSLREMALIDW